MEQELIIKSVIQNVGIPDKFVRNTIELLQEGSTIHFIARYRKEKTNSLDEEQLRNIENKFEYYTELEKRKKTVLKSIKEQDKLTPELEKRIIECREKLKLEDIYLPYKPKRRTKATIAKEKGLEPLADIILVDQITEGVKESIIAGFINPEKKVYSSEDVIIGTLDIISEKLSEVVEVRGILREYTLNKGNIISKPQKEWVGKKSKYEDYYSLSEPIKKSPSHRILAIRRGAKEGVLSWKIEVEEVIAFSLIEELIVKNKKSIFFEELLIAVRQSYKKMLCPSIELEVFMLKLKEAELEAISVFSKNLRKLLLAPPAGHKNILGVDPGYRAGCKMAVIDSNGNFKDNDQMFPHPPQNKSSSAEKILVNLIKKYKIDLVAIGHGTASKETDVFVKEIVKKNRLDCKVVVVNEAGASVYSASATAKREFPDLDILVRGAISIARRLQDPLSELIKIDPKSIGVGQYQHDVNQAELKKNLGFVVESCVNHVGVDLNTASQDILSFISGV
ncbi:MAG: RNA-binding transcriptional accessory protein, partial [Candidatus Omnitrophica bacterium]|nr:RNA-binding transcriptional accessory protein [Candidatus Omnitrophota bacterium]